MGVVLLLGFIRPAIALSPEQKKLYDSNVLYFDIEPSARSCGSSSTALSGAENESKIFNFFISKGLPAFQVAGMMGNMKAESGYEPRLVQYGEKNSRGEVSKPGQPSSLDDTPPPGARTGYGIVQFTPATKIIPASKRLNLPPGDLGFQVALIWEQLNGESEIPEKAAGDHLKQTTNVDDATRSFEYKYERHAVNPATAIVRINFARDILARLGSGSTSNAPTSDSTTCGSSSGQVTGGYSLPVDRKWYDQHKDWFTDTHRRYPASDIPVPTGTSVYSMTDGTVVAVRPNGDCGMGVIVDRDDGVRFTYCHGSDGGSVAGAKPGDKVKAGQKIMSSASTGDSSGPHLHLQIDIKGTGHCPQTLFVGIAEGNPPDPKSLPTSGCTHQ